MTHKTKRINLCLHFYYLLNYNLLLTCHTRREAGPHQAPLNNRKHKRHFRSLEFSCYMLPQRTEQPCLLSQQPAVMSRLHVQLSLDTSHSSLMPHGGFRKPLGLVTVSWPMTLGSKVTQSLPCCKWPSFTWDWVGV